MGRELEALAPAVIPNTSPCSKRGRRWPGRSRTGIGAVIPRSKATWESVSPRPFVGADAYDRQPNFGTKFGWRKPCLRYISPQIGTLGARVGGGLRPAPPGVAGNSDGRAMSVPSPVPRRAKGSLVQRGSEPSAAGGRCSEVSEWLRSKFCERSASKEFWAPQQELSTKGRLRDCPRLLDTLGMLSAAMPSHPCRRRSTLRRWPGRPRRAPPPFRRGR